MDYASSCELTGDEWSPVSGKGARVNGPRYRLDPPAPDEAFTSPSAPRRPRHRELPPRDARIPAGGKGSRRTIAGA